MTVLTIGRASDNSLVLSDQSVSRYHARVYQQSGQWYIKDMQSTHGTYVNGNKIEGPINLRPNDIIEISDVKLDFDGRSLLSSQGRTLLSLTVYQQLGSRPLPGNQPVLARASVNQGQQKQTGVIALAAVASAVLLIAAIILVFTNIPGNPESPSPTANTITPQAVVEYGTIQYDGGEYTGWLKNGLPHGQGTIVYVNSGTSNSFYDVLLFGRSRNQEYTGEWQNGLKHGYGRMVHPDRSVQEGYWENDSFIGQSVN